MSKLDDKLIKHMLNELEDPYKPLNQWEEGFIESIIDQWDLKHYLSDKQCDILERIYNEKTS